MPALAELSEAAALDNAEITGAVWSGQIAKRATFDSLRLIDPDLTAARLREGGWSDVEVAGGQLGGLDLTGTSWRRITVARARLSGAVFSECELKDITFTDTKLDLANFRHASLVRVSFVRCQLTEAAFGGAKLSEVTFEACDLASAEFSGTAMKNVDLRGSKLSSITGLSGLKGATVSPDQIVGLLPEFAAEYGIIVQND